MSGPVKWKSFEFYPLPEGDLRDYEQEFIDDYGLDNLANIINARRKGHR